MNFAITDEVTLIEVALIQYAKRVIDPTVGFPRGSSKPLKFELRFNRLHTETIMATHSATERNQRNARLNIRTSSQQQQMPEPESRSIIPLVTGYASS